MLEAREEDTGLTPAPPNDIAAPGLHLFQAMAGAEHGGAELFFERLALGFHACGLSQTVAVRPWPARMEALKAGGVDARTLGYSRFPEFWGRWRLGRMIRASGADLVLSWMNRATALTPRLSIPHVARLGGFYDLKHYGNCDWLVANTKGIADYLVRSGWNAGRMRVLANFVPDGLNAEPGPRPGGGEPVFVGLGRLHPNKGFDTLLKALANLPEGRLVLAGEGPERAALEALAEDSGLRERVEFRGWQSNPQSFIRSGDVFVCPSRHEPFGNVIIEAFASRMPVVTTATDGALENVRDGTDALVVPVDDADAMADAMARLAAENSLAKAIASEAYATYRAGFTRDAVIRNWFGFLAEVVG